MANIQISVLIPDELVFAADDTAGKEDRSRNYILTRWLESGMALDRGGRWRLVDLKKNSEVSGTSGGGAEFPVQDVGMNATGDGVGFGLPGPGFGADMEITPSSGNVFADLGLPDAEALDQPVRAGDFPKVPQEVVDFAKHLHDKVEALTGADPQILNQTEKPHARTLQGVDAAEQQRNAKSQKIANLKTSPQSVVGRIRKKIAKVPAPKPLDGAGVVAEIQKHAAGRPVTEITLTVPPPGSGHDPKSCKVYGCLMCKAAKEGK